jgi:ribonuclease BN (tRNA processing enzyme)
VHVRVIGSSPAWPNPDGAHAGYLVEANGTRVLLDCGPGVLARLRERETWPMVDAIVISHFHLDHFGDLVPWVWGIKHRPERGGAELWVPPDGSAVLADLGARLGYPAMFEDTFELREYAALEPFRAGSIALLAAPMVHYRMPCHALRAEADGRSLVYSADTGPTPALADLARDADLFICEATLETGADDGDIRGHLSADEALEAAREARARHVVLTHRPSELPVPDGVELAYDGLELDV